MNNSDFRKMAAGVVIFATAVAAVLYLFSRPGPSVSPAHPHSTEDARARTPAVSHDLGESGGEAGTTREFLDYYKAHKDEAKQLRSQCFARIKSGDIPKGEDRQRCSAANTVMGG